MCIGGNCKCDCYKSLAINIATTYLLVMVINIDIVFINMPKSLKLNFFQVD